jgi:hypothetical protein
MACQWGTHYLVRALQAVVQPVQGDYASGYVVVSAIAGMTTLEPGVFGIPIVGGCLEEARTIKVEPNPDTSDGSWEVQPSGTPVLVTSVLGGVRVNLASGTEIRWDPPTNGLTELGVVGAGGLTGGTQHEHFGALRQVVLYQDLGSQAGAVEFFRAKLSDYPAAVLGWVSSRPADGATTPGVGSNNVRLGRGRRLFSHDWELYIVTSRLDGHGVRAREGMVVRDELMAQLTDRCAFRGLPVSGPAGIQITDARMVRTTSTSFVDAIRFSTQYVLERTPAGRTFNPWLRTHLQMSRPTSAGDMGTVDATDPMP